MGNLLANWSDEVEASPIIHFIGGNRNASTSSVTLRVTPSPQGEGYLQLLSHKSDLLFDRLHRGAADGIALVDAGKQIDILIQILLEQV